MQSYRKLKNETHLCDGVRPGHHIVCNGTMYKCTACGHTGCRQTTPDRCTKQAFSVVFGCLKCGAVGKQEMITELPSEDATAKPEAGHEPAAAVNA